MPTWEESYEYWKATSVRGRNSAAFIFCFYEVDMLFGPCLPSWVLIYLNRMHFSLHLGLITKLLPGKPDISCSVRLATNVKNQVHHGNLSVGIPWCPQSLVPHFAQVSAPEWTSSERTSLRTQSSTASLIILYPLTVIRFSQHLSFPKVLQINF